MEPIVTTGAQLRLLPYLNPLKTVLPLTLMRTIPERPGVYSFYGSEGQLLYVGKAKSLKHRVNSYRYLVPERAGRKSIRLIHQIASLKWTECASERDALLVENARLREEKPPFNVANTRPQSYHYIGVRIQSGSLRIRLTASTSGSMGESIHGAFKNRGMLQKSYASLLRWLWCLERPLESEADFPHCFLSGRLPAEFTLGTSEAVAREAAALIAGESDALLERLAARLAPLPAPEGSGAYAYLWTWLRLDLLHLSALFRQAERLRAMTATRALDRAWIHPEEADDFPVEDRFGGTETVPPRKLTTASGPAAREDARQLALFGGAELVFSAG